MKINRKQTLYNILELMVAAAESNCKKTLINLNRRYETELNEIPLSKRNGYIGDYNLVRDSCVYTVYNMFKNSREKLIKDAQGRFSKLRKQLDPHSRDLGDKLLLFSYLIGRTAITVNERGYKKAIGRYRNKKLKPVKERAEDLELLSTKFLGAFDKEYRTDVQLYRLYGRIHTKRGGGWGESINELGRNKQVKKYFGRRISYEDVMQERV